MAGIKINNFGGVMPRWSARLVPDGMAVIADNCKLLSGELRGLRQLKYIADIVGGPAITKVVYRIPAELTGGNDFHMVFDDIDTDIVRAPLTNDSFNRFYWTEPGEVPRYNTLARIVAADDPFILGVPAPTTAPTVVPPGGGVTETRAYVYTFVSAYGEEGRPSAPTIDDGDEAGTWELSVLETTVPDASERNITLKRIYRTVSGNQFTDFFFVDEIPLAQTTYSDTTTNLEAASNNLLESTSWGPPPADMENLTVLPNGFLAGSSGRDIYFSEPYRPHAWPAEYTISVDYEVVGLGVWGTTLVIATTSNPYACTGINPAGMSLQKFGLTEPCLRKRSVVSTPAGVFYASQNGLVLIGAQGPKLVSYPLVTKIEWGIQYSPSKITAVRYGEDYLAFYTEGPITVDGILRDGFLLSLQEARPALQHFNLFPDVTGLNMDAFTGDVLLVRTDSIWQWDPIDTFALNYTWQSKEYALKRPINIGAMHVRFKATVETLGEDTVANLEQYNATRIGFPLDTLNHYPLGGHAVYTDAGFPPTPVQGRQPLGGSPLYNLAQEGVATVRVKLFSHKELIFDTVITSDGTVKPPSGFKSDVWSVCVQSNVDIYSIAMAETGKELADL